MDLTHSQEHPKRGGFCAPFLFKIQKDQVERVNADEGLGQDRRSIRYSWGACSATLLQFPSFATGSNFFESPDCFTMAMSWEQSTASGTTCCSDRREKIIVKEYQTTSASLDSAASAWSTTVLPARRHACSGQGEVIQQADCRRGDLKQEVADQTNEVDEEEGFGEYDPDESAHPAGISSESGLENRADEPEARAAGLGGDEDEVTSLPAKRRRLED